jgi:predicted ArsR family transcriptional regulator
MVPIEQRAVKILSLCNRSTLSVSEIVSKAGGNHEKMIETMNELYSRSLVQLRIEKGEGRGRPKHLVTTTPLGRQFVDEYERLLNLRLQSRDSDIKKALHQAELARRLRDRGISPYARFQEINELARNIARTSQAKQSA